MTRKEKLLYYMLFSLLTLLSCAVVFAIYAVYGIIYKPAFILLLFVIIITLVSPVLGEENLGNLSIKRHIYYPAIAFACIVLIMLAVLKQL